MIKVLDIQSKLGVKNISDLTIKAVKPIYETKSSSNKHIKRCKRHGAELLDEITGIYIHENLAFSIIMDRRTPKSVEF